MLLSSPSDLAFIAGTASISALRKSSSSMPYFSLQNGENILFHILTVGIRERNGTRHQIQLFRRNAVRHFSDILFCRQMRQQVGDEKDGIFRILSDIDADRRPVRQNDDAVQSQRNRRPLIFFDSAVIMCLQQRQTAVLVERILLQIETGRIDMSAYRLKALCQRVLCR